MNSSFLIKSFSFLSAALSFALVPQFSFAKQIWLSCEPQAISFNLNPPKPVKDGKNFLLTLDGDKERFELQDNNDNSIFQGKATFFKSQIQFEYVKTMPSISFNKVFSVDRETLNFTEITKSKLVNGTLIHIEITGLCKVMSAPSSKKNLI
jgi:hypothetical protein